MDLIHLRELCRPHTASAEAREAELPLRVGLSKENHSQVQRGLPVEPQNVTPAFFLRSEVTCHLRMERPHCVPILTPPLGLLTAHWGPRWWVPPRGAARHLRGITGGVTAAPELRVSGCTPAGALAGRGCGARGEPGCA